MDESRHSIPAPAIGDEPECNPSSNPWFADIVERRYGRREIVQGGLAATIGSMVAVPALAGDEGGVEALEQQGYGHHPHRHRIGPGFDAVAAFNSGKEDQVVVPEGYSVQVLIPEGTPIVEGAAAYIPGDFNTGADREKQAGAHHDGMHFFPLARGTRGSQHGVLCVNHENIDQPFIHPNGYTRNADGSRPVEDEVRKEVASKKRTALGRMGHEGAWIAPAKPGKPIVVYMGDDSRGEYVYKFVSKKPYWPWDGDGDKYLDAGTLYVARFNQDGSGVWIALDLGKNGLTPENGFASQADILVNTRSAADYVLATRMDRPEWAVVDERSGHVYLTLTNNSSRGTAANQPVDAANPRRGNPDGHIVRWRERKGDYAATEFTWDIFAFAGPTAETIQSLGPVAPYNGDPLYAAQVFPGSARQAFLGDEATFNSPDGLWVDSHTGLVWIQTDGYSNPARGFGNQQMLAANPDTGVVKRFLVGPLGCELTGITATPDRRTLFVNIQHPDGQWPNINGETRPRSATLVITKDDGGVIGS